MNYFITGGTGFIGTHLTKLLKEVHPEANIYNLDIVEPGTPLPAVKGHYHSPLKEGETLASKFIYCDVRKPIKLDVPVSSEDIIFNFAAVHRTRGIPTMSILKPISVGQKMYARLQKSTESRK